MSPVMLSTLEDGKIVRGLSGIPSEGPVLLVGYHNLMGFEVHTMVPQFLIERKILLRGLTHPILFVDSKDGGLPDLGPYDKFRIMGAVPVSAVNFYKLMSSKSHALLYPGGMREAMHRKVNTISFTKLYSILFCATLSSLALLIGFVCFSDSSIRACLLLIILSL